MKKTLSIGVVFVLTWAAGATAQQSSPGNSGTVDQATLDQAYAKLRARQAAAATRPVATRPAEATVPMARPAGLGVGQWALAYRLALHQNYIPEHIATARHDMQIASARGSFVGELKQRIVDLQNDMEAEARGDYPRLGLFAGRVGIAGWAETFKILQVIDSRNMRAEYGDQDIWLSGVDTQGLSDDKQLSAPGWYWGSGTKSYDTVVGQRTVILIEPISDNGVFDAVKWLRSPAGATELLAARARFSPGDY